VGLGSEVKFTRAAGQQPLILVPACVSGQGPFQFIVDTGAGTCLLSPELAQRLRIKTTATKEGMGAGGKITVSLGRVDSLTIGDAKVQKAQVGITDEVYNLCAAVGAKIDGVIGYNYLKEFCLTVDYQAAALRLEQSDSKHSRSPGAGFSEVGFQLAHPSKPLILVSALANKRGPYQFVLDTGASTTLGSAELARELGLKSVTSPELCGAGGKLQASLDTLESLELGTARCEQLQVAVVDFLSPMSRTVGARLDGIVGYNFLKRYRITVDYPKGTVRFEEARCLESAGV
jgi:predicted aspartyl protease